MKITIKTLNQGVFTLDVMPSETVLHLKELLTVEHKSILGDVEPVSMKLIYSGKILADDKTLHEYSIQEKDFLVLMITKTRATSSTNPSTTSSLPLESASVNESKNVPQNLATSTISSTQMTSATTDGHVSTGASALVTGPEYIKALDQLMEMGFKRDQVVKAMRKAFHNPDRAVEYLMSGDLEMDQVEESQQANPLHLEQTSLQPSGGDVDDLDEVPGQPAVSLDDDDFDNLMGQDMSASAVLELFQNDPQFRQLRYLIQRDPALLEPTLQQIAQSNPILMELINQHQDTFMRLLTEPIEEPILDSPGGGMGADESDERRGNMRQSQPSVHYIQISQEEKEAIDRLVALGFDRRKAIEAFLLCDRNENHAANYLFDHVHEDE